MDARVKRTLVVACIAALAIGAISCTVGKADKAPAGPPLPWHSTLDKALLVAKQKHSPIVVDFYIDGCSWCRKMDKQTFTDPGVRAKLGEFVLLKLDGDKFPEVAEKYAVDGYPTTVVLDEDGKLLAQRPGFMPPKDYIALLDEAKAAK
ncbi:MAG TPA: thioredoxin fold domain-containing protein [Planctomycetota bacterium]|nr:thioredoxin fold domain-containing protein [Planctomycetota bacterium]